MFPLTTDYRTISAVRPALSSFAAQKIQQKFVHEAKNTTGPLGGLHVMSKNKGLGKGEWEDVGAITVHQVKELLQKHQPLSFAMLSAIATGRNPHTARRPPELVVTHSLSSLNFSQNNEARLLPLARGILSFAHSVPVDIMAYSCRVAEMPAYCTILDLVKGLGAQESTKLLELGRDTMKAGFLQFDNVQNYMRQWDHRIGRTNHLNKLNIGLAATYCELDGIDIASLDLEKNRKCAL
ncbi:hypothetical protein EST38_g13736 [Candolleomyces aberdarensis]|uniref:Uncharacterized protein n=1 Tax=Candolleomyces aberdarensis TaxID=2316362 RepID=A0A4V1Q1M6_9AGAR|nr:hypothetical protein EST38_g13736 [Candolleomyces aberdarensis]